MTGREVYDNFSAVYNLASRTLKLYILLLSAGIFQSVETRIEYRNNLNTKRK